jgi:signal transduction histidine kinase
MKPALTWTIALGGLLLLAGAMAWATYSLMGMERTQHRMAVDAAVQERARLALWRMESLAAALVVGESARPPDQYQATPDTAPAVSPDGPILLHFELDPDGRVLSPQVLSGPDKPPVPDESARRLQELRVRLTEKADSQQWSMVGIDPQTRTTADNRAWLAIRNGTLDPPMPATAALEVAAVAPAPKVVSDEVGDSVPSLPVTKENRSKKVEGNEYQPPQFNFKPAEAKQEQDFNNKKEAVMRQRVVEDLAKVTASQRGFSDKNEYAKTKAAAKPQAAAVGKNYNVRSEESIRSDAYKAPAAFVPAPAPPAAPATAAVSDLAAAVPADAPANQGNPALQTRREAEPQPSNITVSDFRALWIKDALLLTRRVSRNGASAIQGAWVDWPQLRTSLLAAISDLFPAASLEAAPASTTGGTDLLASLPIRFIAGSFDIPPPLFWSPLKLSLATAWGCVLLASIAVALVLRGMMLLSERRAAFVSAVTHELRTPLATFKLYSEMLADGLVKDPAKRQTYLETLTTEADRLGHLVENVLAYSRLERGHGSDGQVSINVRDLIQRVQPRLAQRTAQAGAEFSLHHEGLPDDFSLVTDPSAVEQILFNLVDNACKYARRGDAPANLEVVLTTSGNALQLAVRDHGPGISRAEARRLFRPFHKSAREAAHTAPGVGLGLSLCRRLASDLGGTLKIDHAWPHGACFTLTLPA